MNIFSKSLLTGGSSSIITSDWSDPVTLPAVGGEYNHIGDNTKFIFTDTSHFVTKSGNSWNQPSTSPLVQVGTSAVYSNYNLTDNAIVFNQTAQKSYFYGNISSSSIYETVQVGSQYEYFTDLCVGAGFRIALGSRSLISVQNGSTFSNFSEFSISGFVSVDKCAYLKSKDILIATTAGKTSKANFIDSGGSLTITWNVPTDLPFTYVDKIYAIDDIFVIFGKDNQYGYTKYISYSEDGVTWSAKEEIFSGSDPYICMGYTKAGHKHVIVGYKNTGTLSSPVYVGYIHTSFDLKNWNEKTIDGLQLVDVGYYVSNYETNVLKAITPTQVIQADYQEG